MLILEGIAKTYHNGFTALSGINLRLRAGERLAIVGSSGCGKSTLLRLIAGLSAPSEGQIWFDQAPVLKPNPKVGLIYQEPRLMPWLRVHANVGFCLRSAEPERQRTIQAALARVGMEAYGHYFPKQLSGGMAQRVAIARALAPAPSLILLDEPFSALDAIRRAELQNHFLSLWEQQQISTLLVTHDVEEAILLADRIVVMQAHPGRIKEDLVVEMPLHNRRFEPGFAAIKQHLLDSLRLETED
jgi:sulfonate transport system ATP-binding protein